MHPFDYVMTLMSFVYALAIAHVLATGGDIIAAWKRVRFSWLNAVWMLFALTAVLVWWTGMWGMRSARAWGMGDVTAFFVLGSLLYLEVRLVCLRVPAEGIVDLQAFQREEGWKYLAGFAVLTAFTDFVNVFYFGSGQITEFVHNPVNRIVTIQGLASLAGAVFPNRWIQFGATAIVGAGWVWYFAFTNSALT